MKQTKENKDNFIWTTIKNLDELEKIRMGAMYVFLDDFEEGKKKRDIFLMNYLIKQTF